MNRFPGYMLVAAAMLLTPVISTAGQTCDKLPEARADSAGWELSDDERAEVNATLDQAEALCAEGNEEAAGELLKEAKSELIRDFHKEKMYESN